MYLFVYPFIDGNLALWHARARARIVFLVHVSAVAGVSRCIAATRLRSNELNIACQLEPFPVHIALLRKTLRLTIDMQRASLSFNFAAVEKDFVRIILCEASVEACGSVIYCPRCNRAVLVYLQFHHEVTLNQIVSAAWVFCCSISAPDDDALHLLQRIFHYLHLGIVTERNGYAFRDGLRRRFLFFAC